MALKILHTDHVKVEFRGTLLSKGSFFVSICWLLNFVIPLVLVYRSDGFYLKADNYLEQPDISYKHEMLLLLELQNETSQVVWSTFPKLLALMDASALRTPQITVSSLNLFTTAILILYGWLES